MWRVSLRGLVGWGLSVGLLAAAPACIPLRDEAVTAADLASVQAAFGTLPGATRVAWAPAPGVTRWISAGELARIGRQLGIAITPQPLTRQLTAEPLQPETGGVCLVRMVEPIDREKLLAAMRAAGVGYEIELLSFGPASAPPGRLEFSSRNLPHLPRSPAVPAEMASVLPAAAAPVIPLPLIPLPVIPLPVIQWRGHLISESGRAFPVWARARVAVRRPGLIARRTLEAGQIVGIDAIERVELIDYPAWEAPLAELSLAVGRRVRRAIPAHTPLLPQLLALRRDIERGDSVEVELPLGEPGSEIAGETSATLTAQAESPGRAGEMILLKNPLTGRRFSSKVTGMGRAVMTPERAPARSPSIPLPTPGSPPTPGPPTAGRRGPAMKTPVMKTMEDSPNARP